jgi:hypothetical protein
MSVRYSLSSVPRDNANIEAEGGETVLTDLTNDGTFGLYNITGPRHSKGGVPMFLPEQSFIYSDTDKMKFTKNELAEFGISTKKKMTPAKLSKKYEINDYYAHLQSPYADKIQSTTAELMLKKNMMNLSKVAFGQESKKKFEDGVPLAAHPYLVQQGIDPIDFTAKMEKITREQAQMKAIAALPPEQQQQLMMLQEMMAQMEQQPMQGQQPMQQPMQQDVEQEMMMQEQPMARYGIELPQAQEGNKERTSREAGIQVGGKENTPIYTDDIIGQRTALQEKEGKEAGYDYQSGIYSEGNRPLSQGAIYNNQMVNGKYDPTITADKSTGVYAYGSPEIRSEEAIEDFKYRWGDIIEQIEGFSFDNDADDPQWKKFQVLAEETRKKEHEEQFGSLDSYVPYYSKDGVSGSKFDGVEGLHTFNTPRLKQVIPEKVVETKDPVDPADPIETIIPENYTLPDPEFWLQDQNNLMALGQVDDNLYLPWAPDAEGVQLAPTFDNWRDQVNANNASARTIAQALGAVGGPQAVANSNIQGQAMDANAKAIGRVNRNNIGIANQYGAMQAQYDMAIDAENAKRDVGVYDNTQKALQAADNFRNWRVGQNVALQNAALTNRANTYNLNSTFDNFAIDTTTGGPIGFTNARALQKTGKPQDAEALKQSYYKDISDLSRELGHSPTEAEIKGFYSYTKPQAFNPDMTRGQQEVAARQAGLGYPTGAKGKEIKRMVVPFYTGKMGN